MICVGTVPRHRISNNSYIPLFWKKVLKFLYSNSFIHIKMNYCSYNKNSSSMRWHMYGEMVFLMSMQLNMIFWVLVSIVQSRVKVKFTRTVRVSLPRMSSLARCQANAIELATNGISGIFCGIKCLQIHQNFCRVKFLWTYSYMITLQAVLPLP